MDWQGALRARLIAAGPVTARVGQRIYWVDRPQLTALPSVTLQTVDEQRPQHFEGFDGLRSARVQIDVWAGKHIEATEIADLVIAAVIGEHTGNGIRFLRAELDSIRDLGERTGDQFIHRASTDFIFHYQLAA